MRVVGGEVVLAAGDLAGFLECRHKAELDHEVLRGARARPPAYRDEMVEVLAERGLEHEAAYVASLGAQAVRIESDGDGAAATRRAMEAGAAVIVQGVLAAGRWMGRADILRRVEGESRLGGWHYEVVDTKLAGETAGRTVLQLCVYSELVAEVQGRRPEAFWVVTPGAGGVGFREERYRLAEHDAYVRWVRAAMEEAVPRALAEKTETAGTYPDPVEHCDVCRHWQGCDARRRADDSVWLVAGVGRAEWRELAAMGIDTLAGLAGFAGRLEPERVSRERMEKVREQARVQLDGRRRGEPVHQLLPVEAGRGLARLPAPSAGDLFFDIEGDRLGVAGGREFLFGLAWEVGGEVAYECRWALDAAGERAGFEWVVDTVMRRFADDPGMHVYHYAPYEPAAMKRLMLRYGAREDEVDRLLRAGLFVDLYGVVRQGLRASVESYSIKQLEAFYGFERAGDIRAAGPAVRAVQVALGRGTPEEVSAGLRAEVEAYNRDDCVSALRLRRWLEGLRAGLEVGGTRVPRPEPQGPGDPPPAVSERQARARRVAAELMAGVPEDPAARSEEEAARWLLAQLLEYHRREDKVAWWEFFRLCRLDGEEMVEERDALGGLELDREVGRSKRGLPIHRYRYPEQESSIKEGDGLDTCPDGESIGTVHAIDRVRRTVDIQKKKERQEEHPAAVFNHDVLKGPMAEALIRLGESVAEGGLGRNGQFATAASLLLREPPNVPVDARAGEEQLGRARRIALALGGTVLPIQGPPGTGKTYTAARMIVELARAGRTVGVTAVSHKVIRNLLDEVCAAAAEERVRVPCVQLCKMAISGERDEVTVVKKGEAALGALRDRSAQVVGGTSWLWADPDAAGAVDVLFVDEAGQMALANVLAVAPAGRSLVLCGDPQQLEQPQQAAHPDGTDVSALAHLLDGARTVPEGRGLFLAATWRLAPALCDFTSELFYESRLRPRPENARQELVGQHPFRGAGLYHVPALHAGNASASSAEAAVVARVAALLLGTDWVNVDGARAPLGEADILVVAPYNAQVDLIAETLAGAGLGGVPVGTVDKFQGQEAPVLIFSTASSSPEDAPRGMEFLYDPHRLNVATSRGRCAAILVASPRLFEPACRTPRQIQLASAFCRFRELATVVTV